MRLTRRLAVSLIVAVILVLVVGGIGAGLTLAQQQPTPTLAAPANRTTEKVDKRAITGRIVSVENDRLTVRDQKRRERVVQLHETTIIRRRGKRADRSALAPGASVVAFGSPRADGALDARLVSVNQPAPNR